MEQLDEKEAAKIAATSLAAAQQKSLEMLFDYTKFHIGLYLTLTASYIAAAALKIREGVHLPLEPRLVVPAVICFMLAGLAGGVIASSITQTETRSSKAFLSEQIGPWDVKALRLKALHWTGIEHTAFWLGLVLAALSAAFG